MNARTARANATGLTQVTHSVRDDFVERVGVISQGEGMPRISGRLFGFLLYEGRAFSFAELAELLEVSRGSVSTSARMLTDKGLIERVGRPGDRQDYYQVADGAFEGLLQGAAERAGRARQSIEKALAAIPQDATGRHDRVAGYVRFYTAVEDGLTHAAKRMDA